METKFSMLFRPRNSNAISPVAREVDEAKAADTHAAAVKQVHIASAATKATPAKRQWSALVDRNDVDDTTRGALDALRDTIEEVDERVGIISKAYLGLNAGLAKVELRASEAIANAGGGVGKFVERMVRNDELLSEQTANRLADRFAAAGIAEWPALIEEYVRTRSSYEEHLRALGMPIGLAAVSTYLGNTSDLTGSPNARLALLFTLAGAAMFGRGAKGWTSAAIVPIIEWGEGILGVKQQAGVIVTSVKVDAATRTIATVAGTCSAVAGTKSDQLLFPGALHLMPTDPTLAVLIGTAKAATTGVKLGVGTFSFEYTLSAAATASKTYAALASLNIGSTTSATNGSTELRQATLST